MEEREQKRVLVVEDDQDWIETYTEAFEDLGAYVVSVSSVEEAEEALKNGRFTHVVCDGLGGRWKALAPQVKNRGAIFRVVSATPIGNDVIKKAGASFVDKDDVIKGKVSFRGLISE